MLLAIGYWLSAFDCPDISSFCPIDISTFRHFDNIQTMDFLPEHIESYSLEHSSQESEVLKKLNRETHAKVLRPRMLSGHLLGRFLAFTSRMLKPMRVLELGTYTGYSAICLAEGLQPGGKIETIDHNPELEDFAARYFELAGIQDLVIQHVGEALDIIPRLRGPYDLVFMDADKTNYQRYFDMIYPKMRKGAVLLADNVLWSGKVLEKAYQDDEETLGIIQFNEYIKGHPGVQHLMLPVRDGVMLVEKTVDAG